MTIGVVGMLVAALAGCGSSTLSSSGADRQRVTSTSAGVTEAAAAAGPTMTVSVAPSDVRNGESFHISGGGCLDPANGAPGAFVQTYLTAPLAVAADGSFAGDITAPDYLPPGPNTLGISCFSATGINPLVRAEVSLRVETPYVASVSPTVVAPGADVSFHGDCPGQAPYVWLRITFMSAYAGATFAINGGVNGGTGTIPATATPGAYRITPTCEAQRTPESTRYFQTIDVTIAG